MTIEQRLDHLEKRNKRLTDADLRGADLYGANLTGAILADATLTGAYLGGVKANSSTICPNGKSWYYCAHNENSGPIVQPPRPPMPHDYFR